MASATACGSAPYGITECTQVIGQGLQITSIGGQVKNATSTVIKVEVYFSGPNGHITNTGFFNVNPGGVTAWQTWHNPNPTAQMKAGNYCTEAISPQGLIYSEYCVAVHA